MPATILSLYRTLEARPFGRQLFSWLVCRKAPYFASIRPRIVRLAPGHGEATMAHRRAVTNHIGTVHAIALCNLAEFIGGLTTDASLPAGMRWIPQGMTVRYLHKATGRMHAVATPDIAPHVSDSGYRLPVSVVVSNDAGTAVFSASIEMWVSPRPARET